jgi:hypothetical protein
MPAPIRYAFLLALPLLLISCSDDSSIVDPSVDAMRGSVSLRSVVLSAYTFDTDTISVTPGREKSPDDPISVNFTVTVVKDAAAATPIATLRCDVLTEREGTTLATVDLPVGSGSTTSAVMKLSLRRGDVGEYRVVVNGSTADSKIIVNPVLSRINVIAGKRPPHFCGITMPDSAQLPSSGFVVLKIQACVNDSSGLKDIKRVYFNSFLPDGKPAQGNPFLLTDFGVDGDLVANDGTYSLDIQLPSTSQTGLYRFEFYVFDYGKQSDVTSHTLLVYR